MRCNNLLGLKKISLWSSFGKLYCSCQSFCWLMESPPASLQFKIRIAQNPTTETSRSGVLNLNYHVNISVLIKKSNNNYDNNVSCGSCCIFFFFFFASLIKSSLAYRMESGSWVLTCAFSWLNFRTRKALQQNWSTVIYGNSEGNPL